MLSFEELSVLLTDEEKEFAKSVKIISTNKIKNEEMTPERFLTQVKINKALFPEAWEMVVKRV